MITVFKTEDPRTRLHFPAAAPAEPDFAVSDLHASWLKLSLNPHLDSVPPTAILKVTWTVVPSDAGGWSVALVEAEDESLQSKHLITRAEDATSIAGTGQWTTALPLTTKVGLPYQAILIYHIATATDVKISEVAIEVIENKTDDAG